MFLHNKLHHTKDKVEQQYFCRKWTFFAENGKKSFQRALQHSINKFYDSKKRDRTPDIICRPISLIYSGIYNYRVSLNTTPLPQKECIHHLLKYPAYPPINIFP